MDRFLAAGKVEIRAFPALICRNIAEIVGRFLLQNPGIKRRIMAESVRKTDFLSQLEIVTPKQFEAAEEIFCGFGKTLPMNRDL